MANAPVVEREMAEEDVGFEKTHMGYLGVRRAFDPEICANRVIA